MTGNDFSINKKREELYEKTREELLQREMANSTNYDNNLIKLSSGFLGLSFLFINNVIPLDKAVKIKFLIYSWIFFIATIISIILSFVISQKGISVELNRAWNYYMEGKDEVIKKRNWWQPLVEVFNCAGGLFFIIALILIGLFIYYNTISQKGGV